MQTPFPATVMEVTHTGIKTKFDLWAVRDQPAFENKPVAPVGFYKNAVSLQYNIPPHLFCITSFLLMLHDVCSH